MSTTPEEYAAWLRKIETGTAPTPPLHEYLQWEEYDSNLPWRIDKGHLVNLLEAAVESRDDAVEHLRQARVRLHTLRELVDSPYTAWVEAGPEGGPAMIPVATVRAVLDEPVQCHSEPTSETMSGAHDTLSTEG